MSTKSRMRRSSTRKYKRIKKFAASTTMMFKPSNAFPFKIVLKPGYRGLKPADD